MIAKVSFYAIRFILLSLFFSFYLIMISANADRIEEYLNPLKYFKPAVEKLNNGLYVGGYPNNKALLKLHKERGITRVISLLDPHFPLTRELVAYEKANCQAIGIEFVVVAAHDFTRYRDMLPVIEEILEEAPKVTYIHAYFMSKQLKTITAALSHDERQIPQKQDRQ